MNKKGPIFTKNGSSKIILLDFDDYFDEEDPLHLKLRDLKINVNKEFESRLERKEKEEEEERILCEEEEKEMRKNDSL